jgi:hypothetical protein
MPEFTRIGDLFYIDGKEVPEAEWTALYHEAQVDADDEGDEPDDDSSAR